MIDPNVMAVATGAAGTLVASMLTDGGRVGRSRLMQFLGRSDHSTQRAAVTAYDADTAALQELARAAEADTALSAALAQERNHLIQVWLRRLAEHAAGNPDSLSTLRALGDDAPPAAMKSQHNTGSGVFVNGNVSGGVQIQIGGAEPS